jgi:hypothetical protein
MAEPLRPVDGWAAHAERAGLAPQTRTGAIVRAWRRAGRWGRAGVVWLTRPARLLPGLAAVGCAVAGSWLLWGLGVALLVAAGFCLLLDARTPRG